ncbi:serine/threonine protein kinase [Mesorhizobium sp. RIZ17]|uniref:serine/threonine protein kinase n=1 Tax=Mesorhizobium sp. RIZ17 TaxID=3132743 RepID=UPI003DA8E7B8
MNDSELRELQKHAEGACKAFGWKFGLLLGSGGSSAVFRVERTNGPAALKVYLPRFIKGKEGEVTRNRLNIVKNKIIGHKCSGLVQIYEIDEFDDSPFMLMEAVPGDMLTSVLKLVPPNKIESVVRQIAEAARYLDEIDVTHRDIKSDNIIVNSDFSKATLVDLGVVRIVDDQIGSGTDDDGQLPFVATARYSSPEYMFRLLPQGQELWRALNFYQLGALIHDLIVGEPLFEEIVRQSTNNRYLIAYAVATKIPLVPSRSEVPDRLVTLAQKCLQKDPTVRLAAVSWEDFLTQDRQRDNESFLGLRGRAAPRRAIGLVDVSELARFIKVSIDERLMARKASCRYSIEVLNYSSALINITWKPATDEPATSTEIVVGIEIKILNENIQIIGKASFLDDGEICAKTGPVDIPVGRTEAIEAICIQAYDSFLEASAELLKASMSGETNEPVVEA